MMTRVVHTPTVMTIRGAWEGGRGGGDDAGGGVATGRAGMFIAA